MAETTFGDPRSSGGGAAGDQVEIPPELADALAKDRVAREAFASLPPSHRREHVGYITEAKKPETRARRVERTLEMLRGKGAGRST